MAIYMVTSTCWYPECISVLHVVYSIATGPVISVGHWCFILKVNVIVASCVSWKFDAAVSGNAFQHVLGVVSFLPVSSASSLNVKGFFECNDSLTLVGDQRVASWLTDWFPSVAVSSWKTLNQRRSCGHLNVILVPHTFGRASPLSSLLSSPDTPVSY